MREGVVHHHGEVIQIGSVEVHRPARGVVIGSDPFGGRIGAFDEVTSIGQDVAYVAVVHGTERQGQRAGGLDARRAATPSQAE